MFGLSDRSFAGARGALLHLGTCRWEIRRWGIWSVLVCAGAISSCATVPFDLDEARRDAVQRARRIIMNNDGNDCIDQADLPIAEDLAGVMLSRRT